MSWDEYSDEDLAEEAAADQARERRHLVKTRRSIQPLKEKISMDVKMMHLVTLLQKGFTTIHVRFDSLKTYTYKAPLDMGLAKDDMVVVPAHSGFALVTVVKVDEEPDIDPNAPFGIRWVVQKVDMTRYNDQCAREEEAVKVLRQGQRRRAAEEALNELLKEVNREELQRLLG